MSWNRFAAWMAAAAVWASTSCGGEVRNDISKPKTSDGDSDGSGTVGSTGSDTSTTSDTTTVSSTSGDETSSGESDTGSEETDNTPDTCEDLICRGHGGCKMVSGVPQCVCDFGYKLDETMTECIVDDHCIEFRFLENNCRQYVNSAPAVGLFFGVDFCAGTAVTRDKLTELMDKYGAEFKVLEGEENVLDNPESYYQLVPKPVESYVTVVLDVSKSVIGDEEDGTPPSIDLPQLINRMRAMVASLEPKSGEPRVAVSIFVFGRGVAEYVPFTRNFAILDERLHAIEVDQSFIPRSIGILGSDLYKAVEIGVESTQRIRDLRAAVSLDGVLTTGTVVTITDGNDESGATINGVVQILNRTVNQVISIGISNKVDDEVLSALGPDGNYLAPTPEDWVSAFAEVTQRVNEYPDRAYLLAYCSSRTTGTQDVTVSFNHPASELFRITTATCRYDADLFSSNAADVCRPSTFENECDNLECSGLTACGACADDRCCAAGSCMPPTVRTSCEQQNELCLAQGMICSIHDPDQPEIPPNTDNWRCVRPPTLGEDCYTDCELGVTTCSKADTKTTTKGTCVPAYQDDAIGQCMGAEDCWSLNCTPKNPDNDFDPNMCLPPAELYHFCGPPGEAHCELGGYCRSGTCYPRKKTLERCAKGSECRSGDCAAFGSAKLCGGATSCYWSWDYKMRLDNP